MFDLHLQLIQFDFPGKNLWSQATELNHRQPGFCMPDMLLFGQPSKANNYSRELYQAELAWDKQPEVF
jgi:hypothetical protein